MSAVDTIGGGNIEPRGLEEEMRSAYLDYAMSVIVGRALPDVRDGLKPVHRRVLYVMNELGLQPNRKHVKSAQIVGEVMGKYHPHGDASIYDTLVRLAQDFSMRHPLVDGHGNFGNIDGYGAAAMRYCVVGDTRVATTRGTVRIDSLAAGMAAESEIDLDIEVLDRLGRPVRASKVFHSGVHPTLRMVTKEGYELTGTHNHPVLCLVDMAGVPLLLWKLLEELRPGDRVLLARCQQRAQSDPSDDAGSGASPLAALAGLQSRAKTIPESVWSGAREFKRVFLSSLFTGDGSCSLLPRSTIQISYSTYSERLARDVQLLLLEFGVISRLCRYTKGELKVVITNRRDARLFAERVGFRGAKQRKLEAALATIPLTSRALSHDHVPGVASFVRGSARSPDRDSRWLARHNIDRVERWEAGGTAIMERIASEDVRAVIEPLVTGDYYYAEVAEVAEAGTRPVYSLRVETDDHSFITNGFVSHNTEARLDRLATEMLRDLDADTVDFVPTYDGTRQEPLVLPSRFPNLLVNGSSGIAVGMATNIPPHNLREVIGATIAYLDDPDIDVEGLMQHIKGPDFPTAGTILGREGIRDAYATGRGRVRVQAKAHMEPIGQGKEAIIVTELPYQVRKGGDGGLILKIRDLVVDKKLSEISDLRDESDRHGMRLVIELKRDAIPKVVLNKLYKHTPMQTTFGVNMVALVDNVPRTLSLREMIGHYVDHQREVVIRRTQFELRRAEERAHVLEGLLIALQNLDEVIALIRASRDPETARTGLVSRFDLTVVQAQAILQLTLSRLTALEAGKVKEEHADLVERIKELREILGDEARVNALIKEELAEIREVHGDERRTEITHAEGEIDIEDLIADQQMVISITHSGYIKSLPLSTYRQQRRGGVGVTGMDMKDEDYIEHLFVSSTHDYLLFFTNRGKVYRLKVYELPEASRTAKGRALVNLLPLREGERVQSVLSTRDFTEGKYLVFATRNGIVKKTEFLAYNTPIKADGIIAINIRDDDELIAVRRTSGDDDIIMVSRSGQAARFGESQVRPMGRDTSGVRGMNVSQKGNAVLAMDVARDDQELLVVTENGYGKRTPISDYPVKGRGTMGVRTIQLTENKGALAGALVVREHQELVFISQNGMVQRTSVRGINRYGRSSQGVRVMNIRDDDQVSAVALIVDSEATAAPVLGDEPTAALTDAVDATPLDADSDITPPLDDDEDETSASE
jgi:DNA gyrase subunit A